VTDLVKAELGTSKKKTTEITNSIELYCLSIV
jgi:hypothetical protein